MSHATPLDLDQAINAWYESLSEEILRDLQDRFDVQTPRQAWEAFCAACLSSATKTPAASSAAPSVGGQGAGNPLLNGQSGAGMLYWAAA